MKIPITEITLDTFPELKPIDGSEFEMRKGWQWSWQDGMVYAFVRSNTSSSFKKLAERFGKTVEIIEAKFEEATLWDKINDDLWVSFNDVQFWAADNGFTREGAIENLKIRASEATKAALM